MIFCGVFDDYGFGQYAAAHDSGQQYHDPFGCSAGNGDSLRADGVFAGDCIYGHCQRFFPCLTFLAVAGIF